MRARTHLNIARLSLQNIEMTYSVSENKHFNRLMFYLGTVLPDIFLTRFIHPHFYAKSAEYVFDKLKEIESKERRGMLAAFRLGKTVHYLIDFCCHVHRTGSIGKVSEHVLYERRINNYLLRNYDRILMENVESTGIYENPEEIISQIKDKLTEYYDAIPCYDLDIMKSIEISSLVYHRLILDYER